MPSRYVATRHLNWGPPPGLNAGDEVPEGEPDRDYAGLIARGDIKDLHVPGRESVDADTLARLERKLDALLAAVGVDDKKAPEKAPEVEKDDKEGDVKSHGRKAEKA